MITYKVFPGSAEFWCKDNKEHRKDGPAAIDDDGTEKWYKDNKRHRDDGT